MSGGSLIDYAWSLVALDLVREFEEDFSKALQETFNRTGARYKVNLIELKAIRSYLSCSNFVVETQMICRYFGCWFWVRPDLLQEPSSEPDTFVEIICTLSWRY